MRAGGRDLRKLLPFLGWVGEWRDSSVVRADVVGFGIPPDFAQNIVDEVTTATFGSTMRNLSLSKLGMRGSGGIEFAVNGSDITVDENLVRPRTDCAEVTTAAG